MEKYFDMITSIVKSKRRDIFNGEHDVMRAVYEYVNVIVDEILEQIDDVKMEYVIDYNKEASGKNSNFSRSDLKDGYFIKSNCGDLGIVMGNKIVYQKGGYNFIDEIIREDMTPIDSPTFKILAVAKNCYSFEHAESCFSDYLNSKVIYRA